MLVLLLGFDLQVSLPLHKYCLSKPSAHEIETTPSKCERVKCFQFKCLTPPRQGSYSPPPENSLQSNALGFPRVGGGDVEASKMCLIQLMFYSMILIP